VFDDLRFQAVVAPDGHVTFKDRHGSADLQILGIPLRLGRTDGTARPSLLGVIERTLRPDPNRVFPTKPPLDYPVLDPTGIWDPALRLPALGRAL
jgi:hypothetical protein